MNPVNHVVGSSGRSPGRNPGRNVGEVTANLAAAATLSSGCTCFKLRSLSRRVTQLYDQTLSPSGLKVTQYSVIAHARRKDGSAGPTVSDLAGALFTDRTTLTRRRKALEQASGGPVHVISGVSRQGLETVLRALYAQILADRAGAPEEGAWQP